MPILRPFVGRTRELEQLHAELKVQKPSLVIAYGRRRIGKSRLLIEAIADTPSIYFQATRVTSALNLAAFKAEISNALGSDPILEGLSSWDSVLHYLGEKAADKHPVSASSLMSSHTSSTKTLPCPQSSRNSGTAALHRKVI